MEARAEEGQGKGETSALMLRLQLRAAVLNLARHPAPLLPLGGLLAVCLGPAGAGGLPTEDGGNNPLRRGTGWWLLHAGPHPVGREMVR